MYRITYIYLMAVIALWCCTQTHAAVDVTTSAQKYAVRPGDAFPVDYVVSWEGAPGAYTVLPPQLPVLDWGTAELLAISTRSIGNRQETRVTVGYRAESTGSHTAPPLSIRVIAWDEPGISQITTVDENTPTQVVESSPATVVVRGSRVGLWAMAGAAMMVALAGLLWQRARRRRLAATTESTLSPAEQAQALLHEARRSRLDGDFYAYYRALCRALECIEPKSHTTLHDKLKQAVDDTGYRGVRPSDDAMEGDFKDVERIVALEVQRIAKEK